MDGDGEGRIVDIETAMAAGRAASLVESRLPKWFERDDDKFILDESGVAMAGLLFGVAVQAYRGEPIHPMFRAYMDAAIAIREGRMPEAVEILFDLKANPAIAEHMSNPVDSYRADVRTINALGLMIEMIRTGERDAEVVSRSDYAPKYGAHGRTDDGESAE